MLKRLFGILNFLGLLLIASSQFVPFANAAPLAKCWRQGWHPDPTMPSERAKSFRQWCFKPEGRMESFNFACPVAGACDGWDGSWSYRIVRGYLLLRDWDYDDRGEGHKVWRKCKMEFPSKGHMNLSECKIAGAGEWYLTRPTAQSK